MNLHTNYKIIDNIALILMDSPPVNSLGHSLRCAIKDNYERADSDPNIKAIVIASNGSIFCAGADINEFNSQKAKSAPTLPTVLNTLEASTKPVIAAIHGLALGGGLELAMACHFRIATEATKLGLPEVNLGLIPGAGGTQRLPRLIGAEKSADLIVSGRQILAAEASELGLVDQLLEKEGNIVDAALAFAKKIVASEIPIRRCADITVDNSNISSNFFSELRQSIAKKTRGYYAPEKAIQSIESALKLPLDEGLAFEAKLFSECMDTPQARAQQHLFFAQRATTKLPNFYPDSTAKEIKTVAIIGAGTMGSGIAMNFLNAGISTLILDLSEQALEHCISTIRKSYELASQRGRLSNEELEQRMSLLHHTTEYADLAKVDLVIEAVFETMDLKRTVFNALDEICKPGCILATNTSTLNVDDIAATTKRPQDVIGLHFFSPANTMRLLEVVRGKATSDNVLNISIKLAQRIKKLPVVVGVCFGFVGNRMIEPYGRECMRLLLEGATPKQIDDALFNFGMAMGPCSVIDLAGHDVSFHIRESRRADLAHDPSYCALGDKLYEMERLGQKTGRGLYIYDGRKKTEDPEIIEYSAQLAEEYRIVRRSISDEEIVERTIFSLINEGAQILDDGIAYRSGDIDLIYTNGYGFPAWRGGPMQYADEIGLTTVVEGIKKYQQQLGDYGDMWFKPTQLLEKLASQGKAFNNFEPGYKK